MEVTPNWQHHSKKLCKPKRNPVAIKQSRARLKALKYKLMHTNQGRTLIVCTLIMAGTQL